MKKTTEIKVYGMMCGHCENAVTKAVNSVEGAVDSIVSFENNSVTITFENSVTTLDTFKGVIIEEGYSLEPQKEPEAEVESGKTHDKVI